MTELIKNNSAGLTVKEEKTDAQLLANFGVSSLSTAANTSCLYSKGTYGELGLMEVVEVLREQALKVHNGDMRGVESMLTAQAFSLNSIFTEMVRRAAVSIDAALSVGEAYMRMALKAQAQCRATLEALAEVKNPRVTNFVGQQNNANQQQVNNGVSHSSEPARTRTEKNSNSSNELLREGRYENLDERGAKTPGKIDPSLEALAAIHRAKDGCG